MLNLPKTSTPSLSSSEINTDSNNIKSNELSHGHIDQDLIQVSHTEIYLDEETKLCNKKQNNLPTTGQSNKNDEITDLPLSAKLWCEITKYLSMDNYKNLIIVNKYFKNVIQSFYLKKESFLQDAIKKLNDILGKNEDEKIINILECLNRKNFLSEIEIDYMEKSGLNFPEETKLELFKKFALKSFDKDNLEEKKQYLNNLKLIIKLVSHNNDYQNKANNPLHAISILEIDSELSVEISKMLLSHGFDINAQDEDGYTPLTLAMNISNSKLSAFFY